MAFFNAFLIIFLVCIATSLQLLVNSSGENHIMLAQKSYKHDADQLLLAQEVSKINQITQNMLAQKSLAEEASKINKITQNMLAQKSYRHNAEQFLLAQEASKINQIAHNMLAGKESKEEGILSAIQAKDTSLLQKAKEDEKKINTVM